MLLKMYVVILKSKNIKKYNFKKKKVVFRLEILKKYILKKKIEYFNRF